MTLKIEKQAGMRNILLGLLTALFFLFGSERVFADSGSYTDVLWTNGYYDSSLGDMAGRRLYLYGLVDSQTDESDNPRDDQIDLASDLPIGRLEAAELLYRLCGTGSTGAGCPFTDVPEEYVDAVAWMFHSGVTRGISDELYGTGEVTGAQFLTMLSRLFSWDSTSVVGWGELGYEEQMLALARENGLSPVGMNLNTFTHGDVYLLLLSLAERQYPDALKPVRAEMSRPYEIRLSAASYLDACEQITLAVQFAPTRIRVDFSPGCPAIDLRAFWEKYSTETSGKNSLTMMLNTSGVYNYNFSRESQFRYALTFHSYAPAYLAEADAADWLRCYEDTAYTQRIAEFRDREIQPLIGQEMADYAKASSAQELLCRIASYDWGEYEAIQSQGHGIRSQSHTITGFLDGGVIVCDGYAKVYQWICRCLGLDCFVVYGRGNGDSHAWNKVKINGIWYNADICWMDTGSGNRYFLKSDEYFKDNRHSFRDNYVLTVYASETNYQSW